MIRRAVRGLLLVGLVGSAPQVAIADRMYTGGFELNSTLTNLEVVATVAHGTISTGAGIARTGTYGMRVLTPTTLTPTGECLRYINTAAGGPYYARVYVWVETAPTLETAIFAFADSTVSMDHKVTIDSSRVLRLYDATTQIGSTTTLSTGQWYRLELLMDGAAAGGSQTLTARIDGTDFASSTTLTLADTTDDRVCMGMNLYSTDANATGDIRFDDYGINDTATAIGTGQALWPGAGSVAYAFPTAIGDNNSTTVLTGCATNFECLDEGVTPDDATSYFAFDTSGDIVEVEVQDSSTIGIGGSDTITLVAVHGRLANDGSANSNWTARVKKVSGGTVASGNTAAFNSVAWVTNDDGEPHTQRLMTYLDPDAGAWTPSTITSMQIGATTSDVAPNPFITMFWAVVEFVPAAGGATGHDRTGLLGVIR